MTKSMSTQKIWTGLLQTKRISRVLLGDLSAQNQLIMLKMISEKDNRVSYP